MKQSIYHYRTALLKIFLERKFSISIGNQIMHLFKNIDPAQKEEIAAKIIPLVEKSTTEQEALMAAKKVIAQI